MSYMYCHLYHAPNSTWNFHLASHFHGVYHPQKIIFSNALGKPPLSKWRALFFSRGSWQPNPELPLRGIWEEGNLGEGWWYREGRQSQPRQKKQRNLFLDLLFLLFSCLYITTLRNKVLSRCALEPHRQLWGWGDFVAGSCANSSNWQV